MRERVRKLLHPRNRTEEIIKQCTEWVEVIVDRKNRHLVRHLVSISL